VYFNRIAVTGPRSAVLGFREDARRRGVPLSLDQLFRKRNLVAPSSDGVPKDISPFHYYAHVLRPTEWHGYTRIDYELEIKNYEVYEFLIPVSRAYRELCFVDSQICLHDGSIIAVYAARGRSSTWNLSMDRCDSHWVLAAKAHGIGKLEDAYEDDSIRSDAEDGMLTEALGHWDKRVLRVLRRRNRLQKPARATRQAAE
jgi:hypothetical protein